ncbi:MAG: carboxypeptidase regulatory-like domain-containing protein [Actinobacteria bacterium]|nr:carboxypeptidase regulatory-like domain-containing protein [Actinomycetota bacterium]
MFDELIRYCELSADVAFVFGSTAFGVQPGANVLNVSAFDAAGNQSAGTDIHFKLDRSLPVPAKLAETTSFLNGWQANPVVNLTWSNGQDSYETATNSPVVRATAWVVKYGNINAGSSVIKTVSGTNVEAINGLRLPSEGLWRIRFRVWDEAGNASDHHEVQVGVDYTVPGAPEITLPSTVGGAELAAGSKVEWTPPPLPPAGICGYAMAFDQSPAADPGTEIEYPARAAFGLMPRSLPHGENFAHLRAISCAGVPGEIVHAAFEVDSEGPEIRTTSPAASGWYDRENPLVAEISDEVGARLALAVDGGPSAWYEGSRVPISLEDGIHQITLLAEDARGNRTQRTLKAESDSSPPLAELDPIDWADPTLVIARVRDRGSGVAAVLFEYRRVGEADWRGFGTPTYASQNTSSLTVGLRFPDETLADGVYDLRVIAYDATGQRIVTGTRSDGSPATLTLPLRARANIQAGFATTIRERKCRSHGKGKRCRRIKNTTVKPRLKVGFGASAVLQGTLRDSAGTAIDGAMLKVYESVLGGSRRLTATVSSDREGAFSLRLMAGPSRRVTIHFDGSETVAPVETEVKLLAEGKVVFDRYPARVRGGTLTTLGGRVFSPGVSIPQDLNVEFQYFARGSWQQLLVAGMVADINGEFVAKVRFPVTRRSVVYRMRARVPSPQSGWPYEAGVSTAHTLVVTR